MAAKTSCPFDPKELASEFEIAERAGVSRREAARWIRSRSFPQPLVRLTAGPVWWWPEVTDWLAAIRKARQPV